MSTETYPYRASQELVLRFHYFPYSFRKCLNTQMLLDVFPDGVICLRIGNGDVPHFLENKCFPESSLMLAEGHQPDDPAHGLAFIAVQCAQFSIQMVRKRLSGM